MMKPVPLFDDRNLGVSMYGLRPLLFSCFFLQMLR